MRDIGAQAKAMFDRLFPERQIMHRSCGAVRGVQMSPGRQALAALSAAGVAGWCVYASASTMLEGPTPASVVSFQDDRARYERWIEDFRGRSEHAREMLKQTTRQYEQARREVETRHDVLRALLEYANGSQLRPVRSDPAPAVFAANENDPPAALRAEPVRLDVARLRDRFEAMLGPSSAEAATGVAVEAAAPPQDFVAYANDPVFAERVANVAARVSAFRRLVYDR